MDILNPLALQCTDVDDDTVVLSLTGELEFTTADRLRGVAKAMLAHGVSRIIVDLERVTFIDSAGMAALVWLYKQMRVRGQVCLVDPKAAHMPAFELLQLTRLMAVYPSVEIALAETES
jgi:anti-sigma B factor antagonist